ncbi:MAG TPA: FAD-dependent oxidoreductase, partial [Acidimicrobiia bacterium]
AEVAQLERSGVRFELNAPIGRAESIDDLLQLHDAVFIGIGAGLPKFLDVPGENLVGVQSANEFLTRVNLMGANRPDAETPVLVGKRVAVIGGGNTALDAVRTAVRTGAESATVYYRRTEDEMPARTEEIRHAREEGVHFEFLLSPVAFGGVGRVESLRLIRMRQAEPGADGRRGVEPIEGSEVDVPVDTVVVAVGNAPNPMLSSTPGLRMSRWGTIITDPETGMTDKPDVFAGGDIVTGGATVILAMGAGRRAAQSIDGYLRTGVVAAGSPD